MKNMLQLKNLTLAKGGLLACTLAFSYRFVSVIFMVMYALFFAWVAHACKVRGITPFTENALIQGRNR